jgi:hypothetical protein
VAPSAQQLASASARKVRNRRVNAHHACTALTYSTAPAPFADRLARKAEKPMKKVAARAQLGQVRRHVAGVRRGWQGPRRQRWQVHRPDPHRGHRRALLPRRRWRASSGRPLAATNPKDALNRSHGTHARPPDSNVSDRPDKGPGDGYVYRALSYVRSIRLLQLVLRLYCRCGVHSRSADMCCGVRGPGRGLHTPVTGRTD